MNKIYMVALVLSINLVSCDSKSKDTKTVENETQQENESNLNALEDVPFEMAQNYFVKNTYVDGQLTDPKITSQAKFDEIFGMAHVMGENGKPTSIDFNKQYVIAQIEKESDNQVTLSVANLEQFDKMIILSYNKMEGKKQSFTTRPFLLLIVDNKYQGTVKVQKN